MADIKEEAYVLEKMEISEDDDEGVEYKSVDEAGEGDEDHIEDIALDSFKEDEDDLNDFNMLKTKTEMKRMAVSKMKGEVTVVEDAVPKTLSRDVVIDDFIRNFLRKFELNKTLNIFQDEWHELQKKGTFHDVQIGLITDMQNKNQKLRTKIDTMQVELKEANIIANQAKSTWEHLRKERDFHKTHQVRVGQEKVDLSQKIKRMKEDHEDYVDKIEMVERQHLQAVKEKALLKLEKDKANKKVNEIQATIKAHEMMVQQQIESSMKKQRQGGKVDTGNAIKGQNTPWPDEFRPNPYLNETHEVWNERSNCQKKVDAHTKGIGGMALHAKKQIVATASDDCTWKIWNLENNENIMTGEGHKDWISAIDFHPAGTHLTTGGGDKSIKVWDFINSSIAHTFADVHTGPIWKLKFHDTGDFILSSSGDGSVKLFDLNSLKMRQQFKSHTDSVNGLNFQPYTNFFVTGSADKSTSIWDMRTGLTMQTFYGHMNAVNDVCFSIGGQYVSSCDSDGIVKLWDIRMVQELLSIDTGDASAYCTVFDKNTKSIAVGCADALIKVINIEKGEVIGTLKGHDEAVNSLYINQNNSAMYSCGNDGKVCLWK